MTGIYCSLKYIFTYVYVNCSVLIYGNKKCQYLAIILENKDKKIKKVYKLDLVFNNLSDRLRTGTNKIALIWQIFQNTIFNARKYFSLSFTFFFPFNERSQRLMRFGRTFLRTESCQGIYSCKQVKRRSFAYLLGYTAALILPFNFHSKTHTVSCNWEESWLNIRSSQLI